LQEKYAHGDYPFGVPSSKEKQKIDYSPK